MIKPKYMYIFFENGQISKHIKYSSELFFDMYLSLTFKTEYYPSGVISKRTTLMNFGETRNSNGTLNIFNTDLNTTDLGSISYK